MRPSPFSVIAVLYFLPLGLIGGSHLQAATSSVVTLIQDTSAITKEERIRELLRITEAVNLGLQMAQNLHAAMQAANPEVTDEIWDRFMSQVESSDFVELVVPIYAKYFTKDEIDQLIEFYDTPVGKKVISQMPMVLQESMAAGERWGEELGARVLAELREEAANAARVDGFDLAAMLPALDDLPTGAKISREGPSEESEGIIGYEREFEAEVLEVFELGSSQVMFASTVVNLFASTTEAIRAVIGVAQQPPLEVREAMQEEGIQDVALEPLDLPVIGTTAAGWLVKIETAVVDFDMYILILAQGRVSAQVMAMGPSGKIALEDVIPLARLMDQRIQSQVPVAPGQTGQASLVAAVKLLVEGEQLALQGSIPDAIAAYSEAQARDSTLTVSGSSWTALCWYGSLWGYAADVMTTCEEAVALVPEEGWIRNSRGVARALTGDTDGAIADFEAFVAWTSVDADREQCQGWIDALRAGTNPFTPDLLELLRKGVNPNSVVLEALLDEPAERLSGPLPQYPDKLRQAGIEGTVLLEFVIDTMGRVEEESIKILRSTNTAFEAPAREVIRQSLYSPGRVRGQAVRVLVSQQIGFTIQREPDTERSRRQRPAVTGEREITPSPPTLVVTDSAAVDELPRLLASPPFQYPDSLRGVGIEGVVVLEFVIDTTGHTEPSSITVVESPHPAFSEIAKDAVLVSVYSPGRKDGVPVPVRVRESLTFRNQR